MRSLGPLTVAFDSGITGMACALVLAATSSSPASPIPIVIFCINHALPGKPAAPPRYVLYNGGEKIGSLIVAMLAQFQDADAAAAFAILAPTQPSLIACARSYKMGFAVRFHDRRHAAMGRNHGTAPFIVAERSEPIVGSG